MHIFIEIALIVSIATVISALMRLLKQPLIVGYILSGVVLGPYVLNFIGPTDYIEVFSKLGIAILLFIVGLGLKPDIVRDVGRVSLITGVGQIIITSAVGFFVMRLLHFPVTASVYGALALTFSSTIIVFKLLYDKGDLGKLYGKIAVGLLLVQDVFAAVILLFVSVIGSSASVTHNVFGFTALFFVKGILFFAALYLLGKYVLPKLSSFFANSQELLFIFSMAWGLGLAAIFYLLGFSLEIGALAAGVALASSTFADEIGSRMKPLRDFFILLFFVMLGSQIILSDLGAVFAPALALSLFVLIGNPLIMIVIMNLLGFKSRTGFLAGLTVAQISEFSLILVALGYSFGHVEREVVSLITLVGIITITGSTYLMLYADRIYPRVRPLLRLIEFRGSAHREKKEEAVANDILIFGYDRVGYDFVHVAEKVNRNYSVVDFDPKSVAKLKRAGIPHHFGDAEDVDFLEDIGFYKAKTVVSTIPDFKTNLHLVDYYRHRNPRGIMVVISHTIRDTKALYEHGASFVVMPHYLGANFASKMIEKHGTEHLAFEKEKIDHLAYLEKRQELTEER